MRHVDCAVRKRLRLGSIILHDSEHEAIDLRRAEIVILILREHNFLARLPVIYLIGTGSDGTVKEPRRCQIAPREEMRGQDGLDHIVDKCRIRRGEANAHRPIVQLRDLAHILEIRRIHRLHQRVHHSLNRELHIRRTQRLAVMPAHIRAQMKHIGIGIGIVLPRRRQRRHSLPRIVAPHKPVKEQTINLPVLIPQRIDLVIVLRAVDDLRPRHLRRALLTAAAHKYGTYEQSAQKKQLFHLTSSLCYIIFPCIIKATQHFCKYYLYCNRKSHKTYCHK